MDEAKHSPRDAAIFIIRRLRDAGHIALLAGGCVRDQLLGLTPHDYDVATDAVPERVAGIFRNARLVGAKFGVVLVRLYSNDVEVATFRADGPYSDGRHPDHVTFGDARQDAGRRDFTINGLFLDPLANRVIDYVGGRADLEARILRTIGDADRRFEEDHLRLLRALRFAARFELAIDPITFDAIRRHAPQLQTISPERIWQELDALLRSPTRARGWELLMASGLRGYIVPSWPTMSEADEVTRGRLSKLPDRPIDSSLALSTALLPIHKDQVYRIALELRLSNRLTDAVSWLVESFPRVLDDAHLELADLKTCMANTEWPNLLDLLRAAELADTGHDEAWQRVNQRASHIQPDDVAPPPLLDGYALTDLGIPQGRHFGAVLRKVYRAQLNEIITSREQAIDLALAAWKSLSSS